MRECSALKKLKLTAGKTLKRRALRDRVTRTGTLQQAAGASPPKRVEAHRDEGDKKPELAPVAVVKERAAL